MLLNVCQFYIFCATDMFATNLGVWMYITNNQALCKQNEHV